MHCHNILTAVTWISSSRADNYPGPNEVLSIALKLTCPPQSQTSCRPRYLWNGDQRVHGACTYEHKVLFPGLTHLVHEKWEQAFIVPTISLMNLMCIRDTWEWYTCLTTSVLCTYMHNQVSEFGTHQGYVEVVHIKENKCSCIYNQFSEFDMHQGYLGIAHSCRNKCSMYV